MLPRLNKITQVKFLTSGDFPSGPVVKTLPSSAGGMGLIPDQGTKIPHTTLCSQKKVLVKKKNWLGLPGSPVVKTLSSQGRGHGLHPWSGKIPHAAWHSQASTPGHPAPETTLFATTQSCRCQAKINWAFPLCHRKSWMVL